MEEYDDSGAYNGDTEHDMWVDFDHYENTGYPHVFDKKILMNIWTTLTTGNRGKSSYCCL